MNKRTHSRLLLLAVILVGGGVYYAIETGGLVRNPTQQKSQIANTDPAVDAGASIQVFKSKFKQAIQTGDQQFVRQIFSRWAQKNHKQLSPQQLQGFFSAWAPLVTQEGEHTCFSPDFCEIAFNNEATKKTMVINFQRIAGSWYFAIKRTIQQVGNGPRKSGT